MVKKKAYLFLIVLIMLTPLFAIFPASSFNPETDILFEYGAETGVLQPPFDDVKGDGIEYGLAEVSETHARNGSKSIYMYQKPSLKTENERRVHIREHGSSHQQDEFYLSWWVYFDNRWLTTDPDGWGTTLGGWQWWFREGNALRFWSGRWHISKTARNIQFAQGEHKFPTMEVVSVGNGYTSKPITNYLNQWVGFQIYFKKHATEGIVRAWFYTETDGEELVYEATNLCTDPTTYSAWNNRDMSYFRGDVPEVVIELYQGTHSFESWVWVDDIVLATDKIPYNYGMGEQDEDPPDPPPIFQTSAVLHLISDSQAPLPNILINGTYPTNASGYYKWSGLSEGQSYVFVVEKPSGYFPAWVLNVNGTFRYNGTHYILTHYLEESEYGYLKIYFQNKNQSFISYSDSMLTSVSLTQSRFYLSSGSGTVNVSTLDRGKPLTIRYDGVDQTENDTWNFNNDILSLTIASTNVVVYWDDISGNPSGVSSGVQVNTNDAFNLVFYESDALTFQHMYVPFVVEEFKVTLTVQSGTLNGSNGDLTMWHSSGRLAFTSLNASTFALSSTANYINIRVNGQPYVAPVTIQLNDNVIIEWGTIGWSSIPLIMGLIGLAMIILTPTYTVYQVKKKKNYIWLVYCLVLLAIGYGFLVGWLL